MPTLDSADIQRLLLDGLLELDGAIFLRFGHPAGASAAPAAKQWLREIFPGVTPALADAVEPVVQIAFTARGLETFGLDAETRAGFSLPFRQGMVTPHRSLALGDLGESSPEQWSWGHPKDPLDGVLLLYGREIEPLRALAQAHEKRLGEAGFDVARLPECRLLQARSGLRLKEHFGFDDGIANPNIRGYGKGGRDENRLAPGEIVLGYPNEMGRFPPSPTIPPGVGLGIALPDGDFGRNGSYLVVRQLEQRVAAFWRHLLDATGDEQRAVQLAAQMVGRWRNGAPLARYAQEPQRDGAPDDDDFGYAADREGHGCPLGAHVRRSNPRDAVPSMEPEESLAASRRRRLLRRGRTYGEPADGFPLDVKRMAESSDGERGLFFLCFNADLETQFEFIQQSWIGSRKFAGLSNDADPLLSNPEWPPRKGPTDFTVQQELGSRRYRGLPSFTRVRGGAYLFLPGRRALGFLANA